MKNLIVILDPAHGANVLGKCSPDKSHREYIWSRQRVKNLSLILTNLGYEVFVTTDSENEPGLSKRKNFATQIRKGTRKLLLSLHNNAAGNGDNWMSARGVEVFTTPGITDSDICADILLKQIKKDFPTLRMRYNKDAMLHRDKESNFTVLMGSGYMGVLIEWLFQDNKEDVRLLSSSEVNTKLENTLVTAIESINEYFGA